MFERSLIIIGGAGYIGRHIVPMLSDRNWRITVVDPQASAVFPRGVARIDAAPTTPDEFAQVIAGHDHVIQLAAATDVTSGVRKGFSEVAATVTLTTALAEAVSAEGCRLTYFSSAAVYGEAQGEADEDRTPIRPLSAYGAAKAAAEAVLSGCAATWGIDVTVIRPGSVVGGAMDRGVIPALLRQALTTGQITYLGSGDQTRSFVHVSTVAAALDTIMRGARRGFEVFNLAGDGSTTVREVADLVCAALARGSAGPSGAAAPFGEARSITLGVARLSGLLGERPPSSLTAARRAVDDLLQLGEETQLRDDEQYRQTLKRGGERA